jgi:hypothetical protein
MPVPLQRPNTSLLSPMETMGDHANDIAQVHRAEAERAARQGLEARPGMKARLRSRLGELLGRFRRR